MGNGISFVKKTKKNKKDVSIIHFSEFLDNKSEEETKGIEAYGLMTKPFHFIKPIASNYS